MTKWLVPALFLLGTILFLPFPVSAVSTSLVIHDFQVSGVGGAYDEFVSIENISTAPISLQNYSVSRKSKTATSWNTLYKFATATMIAPHQVLVFANPKYTGVSDFYYSTSSYSLTSDNSIAIISPDKSIVDLVGYGDAISFEGIPLPNPDASEIFTRTGDTDNNINDFFSSNKASILDPNIDKVVISELMPNPSYGGEWFELYNETNLEVSLAGTKVCDGMGSVHCFSLPIGETLGPNEYKTYSQTVTKITLNNDGDWLEFRDNDDNVLADTGGDYGSADKDVSLALFGDVFEWTATPTPAAQNIYTDTVEVESDSDSASKTASSKKTTIKKIASAKSTDSGSNGSGDEVVKAAETGPIAKSVTAQSSDSKSQNQLFGYGLIALAVSVLFGYNLWEKRESVRNLYYKIIHRNP